MSNKRVVFICITKILQYVTRPNGTTIVHISVLIL